MSRKIKDLPLFSRVRILRKSYDILPSDVCIICDKDEDYTNILLDGFTKYKVNSNLIEDTHFVVYNKSIGDIVIGEFVHIDDDKESYIGKIVGRDNKRTYVLLSSETGETKSFENSFKDFAPVVMYEWVKATLFMNGQRLSFETNECSKIVQSRIGLISERIKEGNICFYLDIGEDRDLICAFDKYDESPIFVKVNDIIDFLGINKYFSSNVLYDNLDKGIITKLDKEDSLGLILDNIGGLE